MTIDPFWAATALSLTFILQIILVLVICLFRRRSYTPEDLDENSSLLIGSYRKFEENTNSLTNFDNAYMTLQFYIRGMPRLEYLTKYKSLDSTANPYWFVVRDKTLAKAMNKVRLLPVASGNCIAKIKLNPKLKRSIKNNGTFNIALDILFTIKDELCPYILPVFDAKYFQDRDSLLILHEYVHKGSLRDKLLGLKPFHHLTSSPNSKKIKCGKALPVEMIISYSKQILMGLLFLDKLHYPLKKTHMWLHAGNIMVNGKMCKLSGYEEELFQAKDITEWDNTARAGLADVGQVIFEMATGFPVNYAGKINLDPGRKRLMLRRKEQLRDIHFEYLRAVTHPEILQLVQFLCDENKCASLHVSIHHPLFDAVTNVQLVEPEDVTVTSLNTLYRSLAERSRSTGDS